MRRYTPHPLRHDMDPRDKRAFQELMEAVGRLTQARQSEDRSNSPGENQAGLALPPEIGADRDGQLITVTTGGLITSIPIAPSDTSVGLRFTAAPRVATNLGNLRLQGDFIPRNSYDVLYLISDGLYWYEISRGQSGAPTLVPASGWGAVPDTGGDMTDRIIAAFSGGANFFQPGTYVCSGPISALLSSQAVWAYGAIFDYGATDLTGVSAFSLGDLTSTQVRQTVISGLTIRRDYTFHYDTAFAGPGTGIAYDGLTVAATNRCELRDIQVEGFDRAYYLIGRNGVTGAGCSENVLHACRALNNRYPFTLEQAGADAFVNENDLYSCEHQHSSSFPVAECNHDTYGVEIYRVLWAGVAHQPNNNRTHNCNWEAPSSSPAHRKVRCEGLDNYFPFCRWETHNQRGRAASVTINSGGGGYAIGDLITLTGGTFYRPVILQVTNVAAGAVTAVTPAFTGAYSVQPANPVAQGSTTGGGAGADFNLTWTDVRPGSDGYDITVGKSTLPNTTMVGNEFLYGVELNAIVENDQIEFLDDGSTGARNNKNDFWTRWGSIHSGGNIKPAHRWSAGSVTSIVHAIMNPSTKKDTIRIAAGDGSSQGYVGFVDSVLELVENYLSMDNTTPYDILVNAGMRVGNRVTMRPSGNNLQMFPTVGVSGGFIDLRGGGAASPVVRIGNTNTSAAPTLYLADSAGNVLCMWTAIPSAGILSAFDFNNVAGTFQNRLYLPSGSSELRIQKGLTVNDESGATGDFIVKGDTDSTLFVVDVSSDSVGIGKVPTLGKLDVDGQVYITVASSDALVVDNGSSLQQLRVDTDNNQTYLSAAENIIDGALLDIRHTKRVAVTSPGAYPFTIVFGTHYFINADPTAAAIVVKLPAGPNPGDTYEIQDGTGTCTVVNTLTLDGNGANVNGAPTLVLVTAYVRRVCVYNGTQWLAG